MNESEQHNKNLQYVTPHKSSPPVMPIVAGIFLVLGLLFVFLYSQFPVLYLLAMAGLGGIFLICTVCNLFLQRRRWSKIFVTVMFIAYVVLSVTRIENNSVFEVWASDTWFHLNQSAYESSAQSLSETLTDAPDTDGLWETAANLPFPQSLLVYGGNPVLYRKDGNSLLLNFPHSWGTHYYYATDEISLGWVRGYAPPEQRYRQYGDGWVASTYFF